MESDASESTLSLAAVTTMVARFRTCVPPNLAREGPVAADIGRVERR